MPKPSIDAINAALATVNDPEINRPITELGMVKSVDVERNGTAKIGIYLTVAGCPMRAAITERVTAAVLTVADVTDVRVELDVMSDDQRAAMRNSLRGHDQKEIPFAQPGSTTKVFAIASGKGGVGKSSVTANLAVAMAEMGLSVGLVDADVYGHSIPRILNAMDAPTMVEGMIMPPQSYGVRVISMLPFKPGGVAQPVAFRGPMLHRALEQFLSDVWWGDLDVLLLDLPPGTGDIAISTAQLLPTSELVIVTTPQAASADVAVRAGTLAAQTHQKVAGVIENMSSFPCPHCGEPMDLFGVGGGDLVASMISAELGAQVPLLGQIPFDVALREGGDAGHPLVLSTPEAPAAMALRSIAETLGRKPRGLAGMALGITPAGR
ncbi:MAG: Mrp/NBP35 family ATP-binding protein [Candidatus Nanopelagicales bacterium]|jgi:ATP-binding protein involved in chromosome partitioning|nr:Mrp/NBP35 family ATP-binding protein [Candidatus Nanopelagicales bacterium]MCF8543383.1 Mrp/NBP35 family ATP-binding protein [Candidatus Nanopelagicales bacterium]MCF8557629.1 Mrp/NBP35 family ATP-binding protein [Candidatus Nanopelagicales bacterium]